MPCWKSWWPAAGGEELSRREGGVHERVWFWIIAELRRMKRGRDWTSRTSGDVMRCIMHDVVCFFGCLRS